MPAGRRERALYRCCFFMNMVLLVHVIKTKETSATVMYHIASCSSKFWSVTLETVPFGIREDPKVPYIAVCENLKDVFHVCYEAL